MVKPRSTGAATLRENQHSLGAVGVAETEMVQDSGGEKQPLSGGEWQRRREMGGMGRQNTAKHGVLWGAVRGRQKWPNQGVVEGIPAVESETRLWV